MRWEQGRAEIEQALARGYLQRVTPSREQADRLLDQARRHLATAERAAENDPAGAYALLYDAARKSLVAVLENQGLRPTSKGGHLAVYDAVRAQLGSRASSIKSFDDLRRLRNDAEYPSGETPELDSEDVLEDVPKVQQIIAVAEPLLDAMSPF